MIDAKTFLYTIFQNLDTSEHVCVAKATPKKDGDGVWFNNHLVTDRSWWKWNPVEQAVAWYFCVSTINGDLNEKGTMPARGRKNLVRVWCLVLDDIGTKVAAPDLEPSWEIETSAGNWQWGYMLDPTDRFDEYEALVEWCADQGWSDAGAGGSYRLMRVPGSANMKPGRQGFRSVVQSWDCSVWTLDELAEDLGCDLSSLEIKKTRSAVKAGGATAMEGIDPLLAWLVDAGHVTQDNGGEWIDLICPWSHEHTSGDNTAGYSPLGRGSGDWVQTRAFRCLHEHCKDRKLKAFGDWATKLGAPTVSGYDPLPWLQAQYVYVETGQIVVDINQRTIGGVWQWDLADWKLKHPGKMKIAGADQAVAITSAFINHRDTRRAVDVKYQPVARYSDSGLVLDHGQLRVNTYVPPNWIEVDKEPSVFLEHLTFLAPIAKERELFLDWLAHKIQNPGRRSYAVCMVADGAYGIGRSWLKSMLTRVLQGHVNTASISQLIGKGTSAEQTYNDWVAGCQFLVCEEAKDSGLTADDFYHGYETFKQLVDTRVSEDIRINPKYGRTRMEAIYFNALILSNHADAMALPEDDRRVMVIENPVIKQSPAYYDKLEASLDVEPGRIYWYLMRRDVGGFDSIYPAMTDAKLAMIADTKSPSDQILEWMIENHPRDLITKAQLKTAVIMGAREFNYENIHRKPDVILRKMWGKLKTLRPGDKNGARHTINGDQVELRAVRRYKFWKDQDRDGGHDVMVEEMAREVLKSNIVTFNVD